MSLAFYNDAGHVFDAVFKDRLGLKAVLYNRGFDTKKLAVIKAVVCKTLAVGKPLQAAIRKVDASILKRDHGMMLCICHDLLSGNFRGGGLRVRPLRKALDAIREIIGADILARITNTSRTAKADSKSPACCIAGAMPAFSYFRLNPAFVMRMSSEFAATTVPEDLEQRVMSHLIESVTASCRPVQSHDQRKPGATELSRSLVQHPLSGCITTDEYVPGCYRIETRHIPALLEHQKRGDVVIQDRSSQFSAHAVLREVEMLLLHGKSNITVLDACAAPGSKTSHVIHMLQLLLLRLQRQKSQPEISELPQFRLVAVEKDEERFCILVRRLQQLCGPLWLKESDAKIPGYARDQPPQNFDIDKYFSTSAQSRSKGHERGKGKTGKKRARRTPLPRRHRQVVSGQTRLVFHVPVCCGTLGGVGLELITLCNDFLKLDAEDADGRDVDVLVLDPSCSGSGLSEHAVASAGNASNLNNCLQKRCAAVVDCKRLKVLTDFQTNALTHALTGFPGLHACCYSTCSIFREENELVVLRALGQAPEQGWNSIYPFSFPWPEANTSIASCESLAAANVGSSSLTLLATYQQLRSQSAHSVPEEHQCRGFFLAKLVRKSVDAGSSAATKHKAVAKELLPYSIQLYNQSEENFVRALTRGDSHACGAAEHAALPSRDDAPGAPLLPKKKRKRRCCSTSKLKSRVSTDETSVTMPPPHSAALTGKRKKERRGIVIRR